MIKSLFDGFLDILYPPVCILCKDCVAPSQKDIQLCLSCQDEIKNNRPPFCKKCSRPLKNPYRSFCRTCEQKTHFFDQAWSACIYNESIKKLLHLFKYGHKTALRHIFLLYIDSFVVKYNIPLSFFDLIIPVPLHPTRLRERGFNQSELLAKMIADKYGILLSCNNLRRIRHTPNQARVTKKERWTNTYQAFKIKQPCLVINRNILIMDDLYTTGATTSEIARLLKNAGAKNVSVLTLAIAL